MCPNDGYSYWDGRRWCWSCGRALQRFMGAGGFFTDLEWDPIRCRWTNQVQLCSYECFRIADEWSIDNHRWEAEERQLSLQEKEEEEEKQRLLLREEQQIQEAIEASQENEISINEIDEQEVDPDLIELRRRAQEVWGPD